MDSAEIVSDLLSHHGVKGMHWGVRRDRSKSGEPSEVSVSTKKTVTGKTKLIAKGGEHLPPHPDAIAAKTVTQKLKKSGLHTLSNKELQTVATRSNLENQVKRSGAGDNHYQRGTKFVKNFNKSPDAKLAVKVAGDAAKSKRGRRAVATIATTAALAVRR